MEDYEELVEERVGRDVDNSAQAWSSPKFSIIK